MRVFKCDRCGTIYENNLVPPMQPKYTITKTVSAYNSLSEDIDLCPNCTALLEKFMNRITQIEEDV